MSVRPTTLLRSVKSCLVFVALFGVSGCEGIAAAGPPPGVAPGYGYTCYAGSYVCRLHQQVPQGAQCTCPGIGAPSYGTVH